MKLVRCNSQATDGRISCQPATHTLEPLSAVSFVRKMRGGAQSSLVQANDGNLYVVKLQGNPQGPNVLANEALGSWLAGSVGLDTPAWSQIRIGEDFLSCNPEMWFETPSGRSRPASGLHYASRLVEAEGNGSVYEILPRSWFPRIQNRQDFLGMLLLDLWSGHTDNRQACFIQEQGQRGVHAVFLDHGHMFGGPGAETGSAWDARAAAALFLDRAIYEGLWSDQLVNEWMRKIYAIQADAAYTFVASLPSQWSATPMHNTVASLLKRRPVLQHLIAEARACSQSSTPVRKPVQRAHDLPESLRISSGSLRAYPRSGNQLCVGAAR